MVFVKLKSLSHQRTDLFNALSHKTTEKQNLHCRKPPSKPAERTQITKLSMTIFIDECAVEGWRGEGKGVFSFFRRLQRITKHPWAIFVVLNFSLAVWRRDASYGMSSVARGPILIMRICSFCVNFSSCFSWADVAFWGPALRGSPTKGLFLGCLAKNLQRAPKKPTLGCWNLRLSAGPQCIPLFLRRLHKEAILLGGRRNSRGRSVSQELGSFWWGKSLLWVLSLLLFQGFSWGLNGFNCFF